MAVQRYKDEALRSGYVGLARIRIQRITVKWGKGWATQCSGGLSRVAGIR